MVADGSFFTVKIEERVYSSYIRPLTAKDPNSIKNLTNYVVLQFCRRFKNLSFVKPVINEICNKRLSGTRNRPCTNKQVHISGYISPLELLYNSYP